LWDEAHRYIGDEFFRKGIEAPKLESDVLRKENFGTSQLLVYRNNL
jgi:hypothetical protein